MKKTAKKDKKESKKDKKNDFFLQEENNELMLKEKIVWPEKYWAK